MNYPVGRVAYPIRERAANVDDAAATKVVQTGLARGGTTADYNVKLRGMGMRVDRRPKRPYP